MKEQNELTSRKEAVVISEDVDFAEMTKKIREESSTPAAEVTLEELRETIEKEYGLIITFEKIIDEVQGSGDTSVKVESVKDYNYILCEPSNITSIFSKLINIGYPILDGERFIGDVLGYITRLINEREYSYSHTRIGWGYHLGQKMIKLSKLETEKGTIQSRYTGGLNLNQKGSLDGFVQGIKKLVIGNPRLELALISGVCGLVVQELDESDTNIVINFCGKSSSGKTQTTKIPLTLFGDPNKLFMTFNSTENNTEKEMARYQMLPMIMDDKLVGVSTDDSKRQCREIINAIFRYATGHMKGRMNDRDSLSKHYCPIIISTEESITDIMKSTNTKGQFFRMFEIPCQQGELTSSKEHSKQLEQFMRSNYGLAIEAFAQWLMQNNIYGDILKDKFYELHDKVVDAFGKVEYADRMANRISVIMLAGELLNDCFDFKINLDGVLHLLIESVNLAFGKAFEEDIHLKSLKKYIGAYPEYFAECRGDCSRYKHLGQYKSNEFGNKELWIEPSALRYVLSDKEPKDYLDYLGKEIEGKRFETAKKKKPVEQNGLSQILRTWRSKGYLISGRKSGITTTLTSQVTLFNDSKQTNIYIINFKEGE